MRKWIVKYWKDAIVVMATTLFTFILSIVALNTGWFQGRATSIETINDTQFSDYYATVLHSSTSNIRVSPDIVIVSLKDCYNHSKIARLLTVLDSLQPKVIGLDVIFRNYVDSDTILLQSIEKCNRIVLAGEYDTGKKELIQYPIYETLDKPIGVINFTNLPLYKVRSFRPQYQTNDGKSLDCFAGAITKIASPNKYFELLDKNSEIEFINYHRNVDFFDNVYWNSIINDEGQCVIENDAIIKDKIVIIGADKNSNTDLHLTPIKEVWIGAKIHAAAVDTILYSDYVIEASDVWISCVAFAVFFLWSLLLYHSKKKLDSFRVLVLRVIQVVFVVLFYFVGVWLYNRNTYCDLSFIMLGLGLSMICFDIVFGLFDKLFRLFTK